MKLPAWWTLLINRGTNALLNLALILFTASHCILFVILGGLIVVAVEFLIYCLLFKPKGFARKRILSYTLIDHAVSFMAGLILWFLLIIKKCR